MKGIFDLIRSPDGGDEEKTALRLGLRLKVGDQETVCPLTRPFESFEALENGVEFIKEDLGLIVERARERFKGSQPSGEGLDFDEDATPEQIWTLLSKIDDENSFVDMFNRLDGARRKAIAEHVLTHCNVFSGKASVFSLRYDNDSGLME